MQVSKLDEGMCRSNDDDTDTVFSYRCRRLWMDGWQRDAHTLSKTDGDRDNERLQSDIIDMKIAQLCKKTVVKVNDQLYKNIAESRMKWLSNQNQIFNVQDMTLKTSI